MSSKEKSICHIILTLFLVSWVGPFILNQFTSIDGVAVGGIGTSCVLISTFGYLCGYLLGDRFRVVGNQGLVTRVKGDFFSLLVGLLLIVATAAAMFSMARVVGYCGSNIGCLTSMGRNYERVFLKWTPVNYSFFLILFLPTFAAYFYVTEQKRNIFKRVLIGLLLILGGLLSVLTGNKMIPMIYVLFLFGAGVLAKDRKMWKSMILVAMSAFVLFYAVHSMRVRKLASVGVVVHKIEGYMVYNFKNFENYIEADINGKHIIQKNLMPAILSPYLSRISRMASGHLTGERISFSNQSQQDSLLHNRHYNAKTFILGAYSWLGFIGIFLLPMLHSFLQVYLTKKIVRGTRFLFTSISLWLVLLNIMCFYFFNYHYSKPLYHYLIIIGFFVDLSTQALGIAHKQAFRNPSTVPLN